MHDHFWSTVPRADFENTTLNDLWARDHLRLCSSNARDSGITYSRFPTLLDGKVELFLPAGRGVVVHEIMWILKSAPSTMKMKELYATAKAEYRLLEDEYELTWNLRSAAFFPPSLRSEMYYFSYFDLYSRTELP